MSENSQQFEVWKRQQTASTKGIGKCLATFREERAAIIWAKTNYPHDPTVEIVKVCENCGFPHGVIPFMGDN
jgi:hypothetical protein